jgi:hypothetical protein
LDVPRVEPIKVGKQRQLFLDDYLIEKMDKLTRRVCPITKYEGNPVIVKETEREPALLLLYGSVIYDDQEKMYKAWCFGGGGVFYFTSTDGIRWERPQFDMFAAFDGRPSNRVVLSGHPLHHRGADKAWQTYLKGARKEECLAKSWRMFLELFGVTKDLPASDPALRYRMGFLYHEQGYTGPHKSPFHGNERRGLGVAFSPDGIHWTPAQDDPVTYATVDGQTHWFFDDQSNRYVLYGRTKHIAPEVQAKYGANPNFKYHWGRAVARAESADFIHWTPDMGQLILSTDIKDGPMEEIYSMHVFPYEGLYVGLVQVFHNYPERVYLDIRLAVSRDNIHFQRLSDRSPFISVGGVGAWDRFNNSVANSRPIVVGEDLRFYYSGRNVVHGSAFRQADNGRSWPNAVQGAVGFGTVKRDRFAAIEATFDAGTLRTRPLLFQGTRLHVNAGLKFGSLSVALIGTSGKVEEKATIQGQDGIDILVPLKRLSRCAGAPVRLEFTLTNGQLYAFWLD